MGAFFVFGGNRYGVGISFHRRRAGGVLVYVSETVRGLYKAVAVGMGGRGHDRQLLFPVTGHEDAAHGHRLRHLDALLVRIGADFHRLHPLRAGHSRLCPRQKSRF